MINLVVATILMAVALTSTNSVGAASTTTEATRPSITVWTGVYSEAQRQVGLRVYIKECSSCHGEAFRGGETAPSLAGSGFRTRWNERTLGDLFEKIRSTMPPNAPGKLTAEQNADVIACILGANSFPTGLSDLSTDSSQLSQIRMLANK